MMNCDHFGVTEVSYSSVVLEKKLFSFSFHFTIVKAWCSLSWYCLQRQANKKQNAEARITTESATG